MSEATIPADALEAAMREIMQEQREAAINSVSDLPSALIFKGCEHAYDQCLHIIRRHCWHFLEMSDG